MQVFIFSIGLLFLSTRAESSSAKDCEGCGKKEAKSRLRDLVLHNRADIPPPDYPYEPRLIIDPVPEPDEERMGKVNDIAKGFQAMKKSLVKIMKKLMRNYCHSEDSKYPIYNGHGMLVPAMPMSRHVRSAAKDFLGDLISNGEQGFADGLLGNLLSGEQGFNPLLEEMFVHGLVSTLDKKIGKENRGFLCGFVQMVCGLIDLVKATVVNFKKTDEITEELKSGLSLALVQIDQLRHVVEGAGILETPPPPMDICKGDNCECPEGLIGRQPFCYDYEPEGFGTFEPPPPPMEICKIDNCECPEGLIGVPPFCFEPETEPEVYDKCSGDSCKCPEGMIGVQPFCREPEVEPKVHDKCIGDACKCPEGMIGRQPFCSEPETMVVPEEEIALGPAGQPGLPELTPEPQTGLLANTSEPECCDPPCKKYRGIVSVTVEGVECQNWEDHSHHSHPQYTPEKQPGAGLVGNYCRNPSKQKRPWCYTTSEKRWDFCDVPRCSDN